MDLTNKLFNFFLKWLNKEVELPQTIPLSDFNKLSYELRPCDVLLIEGRNRVSQMIKVITRSSWSHAALYIGRLYDIEDKDMQKKITTFYSGDPSEQLVFESLLGKGALISPLKKYEKEHIAGGFILDPFITENDNSKVLNILIDGFMYSFYLNSKNLAEEKKEFFLRQNGTMKILGCVLFQDKGLFERIKQAFDFFRTIKKWLSDFKHIRHGR